MKANKKVSPIVTELVLTGRKLDISLVFILQSYFKVPKAIKVNATHHFIMKKPNKRELQQTVSNFCLMLSLKILKNLCKDYTKEPYSFK